MLCQKKLLSLNIYQLLTAGHVILLNKSWLNRHIRATSNQDFLQETSRSNTVLPIWECKDCCCFFCNFSLSVKQPSMKVYQLLCFLHIFDFEFCLINFFGPVLVLFSGSFCVYQVCFTCVSCLPPLFVQSYHSSWFYNACLCISLSLPPLDSPLVPVFGSFSKDSFYLCSSSFPLLDLGPLAHRPGLRRGRGRGQR